MSLSSLTASAVFTQSTENVAYAKRLSALASVRAAVSSKEANSTSSSKSASNLYKITDPVTVGKRSDFTILNPYTKTARLQAPVTPPIQITQPAPAPVIPSPTSDTTKAAKADPKPVGTIIYDTKGNAIGQTNIHYSTDLPPAPPAVSDDPREKAAAPIKVGPGQTPNDSGQPVSSYIYDTKGNAIGQTNVIRNPDANDTIDTRTPIKVGPGQQPTPPVDTKDDSVENTPIKVGPGQFPVEQQPVDQQPILVTQDDGTSADTAEITPIKVGPGQFPSDPTIKTAIGIPVTPADSTSKLAHIVTERIARAPIEQPISLYPVDELA